MLVKPLVSFSLWGSLMLFSTICNRIVFILAYYFWHLDVNCREECQSLFLRLRRATGRMDGSPVNAPQVSVMSTFLWKLFFVFGWYGPSDGQATASLEAQCVYYIQLDKEASLPHLRRSCFSKGSLQVVNIPGRKPCIPGGKLCIMERKLWWAFHAQTVHIHTEIQGRLRHSYELLHSHRAETLVLDMSMGLKHWSLTCPWGRNIGSWHANSHVNSTHPLKSHHAQGFLHALYIRDTGKIEKSPSGKKLELTRTEQCV